ncbi:MAG: glutamine--tRNA ligase/YqeY domain fusion protein [Thermoguttaceae bacterium]|nr:glutamine--tRNA ligase/YqeY domain fusion protein [Thermoguttaceae bacterium]
MGVDVDNEVLETGDNNEKKSVDFIREFVNEDLAAGRYTGVHTRFPPEPNGYLHIGHAKSICLNFGLAKEYGGPCNLRFDDTNPSKEETEYVESIQGDVRWLGFEWSELHYASDYFDQLYAWAEQLIEQGDAFVCDLDSEQMREYRGSLTAPGKESPYRNRSVAENLDFFRRMRLGEFADGTKTLRAKIDMASPNLNLRDPVLYRILRAEHHRTGNKWCIYPMYDFTHGQSDSIERISHSICTLEFENHRPLYNWFIEKLGIYAPRQIEFARLNLTYTVMSKRKLLQLVKEKRVSGWDDPRMPTISGIRRRGVPPEALREFCARIGVSKQDSTVDYGLLEFCIRENLNRTANRVMGVLKPLKVIIENWPEDLVDELDAVNNPEDLAAGSRKVPISREIYIEQSDFMEEPPKKYFRLAPGAEVRLRWGYLIRCTGFEKDPTTGEVTLVRCTYDPESRGGNAPDGRKVKGTIHWVSAKHAIQAEARLYDKLFMKENPDDVPEGGHWLDNLNPDSVQTISCYVEPSLAAAQPGERFQFERNAYFCVDRDSTPTHMVFNRTVTLKDTWAKIEKK